MLKKLNGTESEIVLTTDHGTVHVDRAVKVLGEKEISSNLKNKIEEAKSAIKKNLTDQALKKTEIDGLKATITQLETKQKSIK